MLAQLTSRRAYGVQYLEAVPDEQNPKYSPPQVIALRNPDDPPETIHQLFSKVNLPLRLVIPYGTYAFAYESGGYAWFEDGTTGQHTPSATSLFDEAAHLAEFAASITDNPTRQLVLCGQSAGGDLALTTAVRYPYLADIVIAINGVLPTEIYGKALNRPPRLPRIYLVQDYNASPLMHRQMQRSYHWLSQRGYMTALTGYRGGPGADTLVAAYIQRLLARA